jgi:hypothetical protein
LPPLRSLFHSVDPLLRRSSMVMAFGIYLGV